MQDVEIDHLNFTPDSWQIPKSAPQQQPTEMERFWLVTGNWGEFGLYFGLGLSASLIVRAIPILQPSALILIPAISAGLTILSFAAPAESRTRYQILLIASTAAIIGGNWDGWIAWLAANAWKIGASMVLIGAAIYLVPASLRGKSNG